MKSWATIIVLCLAGVLFLIFALPVVYVVLRLKSAGNGQQSGKDRQI